MAGSSNTPPFIDLGPPPPTDPEPGEHIGRYVVESRRATGGMATVFVVRDSESDERLALKLLHPVEEADGQQTRFRREFRALSRLLHPNVLQVRNWGMRGARPWFTMELVEGVDLRSAVHSWAELVPEDRFARVHSITVQVARALAYIHDRGLIHRDVTPANIMLRPDGIVRLMDFGLVKAAHQADLTQVGEVVGTVAYIAPEQITGGPLDARADLYALGAVLHFMLTGRKPFSAHTLQGYMDKHLHEKPRSPREIDPLVPELLDKVCLRLMRKEPADRFASATHLLHVLGDASLEVRGDLWPPRTVGRTPIKAWVGEVLDDIEAERCGGALLVTGPPGQGKTRMLDLAEASAKRRGIPTARGRCRTHDRPFGAFVSVFKALRRDGEPGILDVALGADDTDARVERYPVIAAFRDLVVLQAPCVIILDELEKADAATRELLEYLVRNTLKLAEVPVAFVLAYEADHGVLPPLLHSIPSIRRRHLGPLQPSEVEELVLSVLPDSPASTALAGRLYAETDGSPAFIADMLRGLVDEGLIRRSGASYELVLGPEEISQSRLPMPASLRHALGERLAPLPEDALEVGRLLAVSRASLDLDALVEAAPFDEERTMDALDALLDADIVVEERNEDSDRVDLSHNRFRDVLLSSLDAAERRAAHRRMGEILERQNRHGLTPVVEDLAWHFEQAAVPTKAYAYLVKTALKHLNRSLHDESLSFLDRSLAAEPAARVFMLLEEADRMLCTVHFSRAQALYHVGRWNRALNAAQQAARLASDIQDDVLESVVAAEIGNQLRNQGRNQDAEPHLRLAMNRAERAERPDLRAEPLYHLGAILWGRGELHEAEAMWRESLELARKARNVRAEGMAYNGLGIIALCGGRSADARRLLEKSAELFERLGMLQNLAIAQVNVIELHLAMGNLRKALRLSERTVARAREVQHLHGIALGLVWRARLLLVLRRHDEARSNALEALRIARELGTVEDAIAARTTLVQVMLVQGQGAKAMPQLDTLLSSLEQLDQEGITAHIRALQVQALVALGQLERAAAIFDSIERASSYPIIEVRTELDMARAAASLGRTEASREHLNQALSVAHANGFRFYELLSHHHLALLEQDPKLRLPHARSARGLARSLAATLARPDANDFLGREWGGPS